jgi:hypothetical protein
MALLSYDADDKEKTMQSGTAVNKSHKNISGMCKTCGRIRIRIRIKMESLIWIWILIGIKTMPILNTEQKGCIMIRTVPV